MVLVKTIYVRKDALHIFWTHIPQKRSNGIRDLSLLFVVNQDNTMAH